MSIAKGGFNIEVTAIAKQFDKDGKEKFDLMEWSASLTTFGEVSVASVRDMVSKVIKVSAYRKISRLNLVDHGAPSAEYIRIGKNKITTANIEEFRGPLSELAEKFHAKGVTHIQNCYAGRNPALLKLLAKILLVPVYAGTEKHAPWVGYQFGEYVVAYPNGKFNRDVSVP